MAEFANTTHLDLEAPVYSDEEAEVQSGSDAKESDDSSNQQYVESDGAEAGDSAEHSEPAPIQITRVRFSASGKTIIEQVIPQIDEPLASDAAKAEEQAPAITTTAPASDVVKIDEQAQPSIAKVPSSGTADPDTSDSANPGSFPRLFLQVRLLQSAEVPPPSEAAPTTESVVPDAPSA